MKQLNVKSLTKVAGAILAFGLVATQAFAGWSVSGTKVLDPKGNNFIFRGINHAHAWYPDRTATAITDIAATGANSVRIVLANGTQWTRTGGADVAVIVSQCKAAKLVCVLEVHDSTGFGESAAATNISNATTYWTSSDIQSAIIGQEDYVILNIANEPYGNTVSASTFTSETSASIKAIRNAGLTHLIMVDAPNWGQDWSHIMRDNAATIFAADTLSNTMFSVHMYEVYNTPINVQNYFTSFQAKGFALVVGEFGTENNGNNVDEAAVLLYAQQMGIGYMGWSWTGNGSCCVPLDIALNWNPSTLSTWGNFLINSANGIKATSKLATNFTGGTASSSVKSSTATASSVRSSTVTASSKAAVSSSSIASGTGSQCNWYGNTFPICTTTTRGWGWENNGSCIGRTDCAALSAPFGVIGTATSSKAASSRAASTPASSKAASVISVSSRAASSVAGTGSVSCSYVVSNSWGNGFTGAVRITNNGAATKSGWTATWQYAGPNRITSSWNANVTGSNPYSATNLSWNGNIGAGQTVELGFQGATNGSVIEKPAITCK